jgi:hypothetical protein
MDDQRIGSKRLERGLVWIRRLSSLKVLSLAAVTLAFVDTFIHPISLTALGLLAVAGLPWLLALVRSPDWPLKSVELPGGVKVEFNELKQIGEEAADAGLLGAAQHQYSFQAIFDQDPNLAVAGLRIELERRLRELGQRAGVNTDRTAVGYLVRQLEDKHALGRRELSVIADLIPMLNKAVHADDLDPRAFDWAMDVGPQLLAGLDAKIRDFRTSCT